MTRAANKRRRLSGLKRSECHASEQRQACVKEIVNNKACKRRSRGQRIDSLKMAKDKEKLFRGADDKAITFQRAVFIVCNLKRIIKRPKKEDK